MNTKRMMLCMVILLAGSTAQAYPPWYGTIFHWPDTITESDPTTFTGVTYLGQDWRSMYDRRTGSAPRVYAYLFNATFSDGRPSAEIQLNPEFGSVANAQFEAEKYSASIGRLPNALRRDVAKVLIHKGLEKFGGGGGGILIHTGYAEDVYIPDGILEETLAHEACHTSLDADHARSPGWLQAQIDDGDFISEYAMWNPTREDIAESFVPYMAIRYRPNRTPPADYITITTQIPNRIAYFDAQDFDMFPIPEPSSLKLLSIGVVVGVLLLSRRNRRKAERP